MIGSLLRGPSALHCHFVAGSAKAKEVLRPAFGSGTAISMMPAVGRRESGEVSESKDPKARTWELRLMKAAMGDEGGGGAGGLRDEDALLCFAGGQASDVDVDADTEDTTSAKIRAFFSANFKNSSLCSSHR